MNKKELLLFTGVPILSIVVLLIVSNLASLPFPVLFNFTFGLIVFAGYFYLATLQFMQVLRPKDWLTNLRMLILAVLIITIITFLPSLAYQFVRLIGEESEFLRDIVNVTGRISSVCILGILVAIFHYKKNDPDDNLM